MLVAQLAPSQVPVWWCLPPPYKEGGGGATRTTFCCVLGFENLKNRGI